MTKPSKDFLDSFVKGKSVVIDHGKLISALARHERALQDKVRLTKEIGAELAKCTNMAAFEKSYGSPMYKESDWYDAKGNFKNHIWEAYVFRDDFGNYKTTLSRYEFGDFLHETGCSGCLRAWELIQERRAVSQALGSAKRLIRCYGKQAIAADQGAV